MRSFIGAILGGMLAVSFVNVLIVSGQWPFVLGSWPSLLSSIALGLFCGFTGGRAGAHLDREARP